MSFRWFSAQTTCLRRNEPDVTNTHGTHAWMKSCIAATSEWSAHHIAIKKCWVYVTLTDAGCARNTRNSTRAAHAHNIVKGASRVS